MTEKQTDPREDGQVQEEQSLADSLAEAFDAMETDDVEASADDHDDEVEETEETEEVEASSEEETVTQEEAKEAEESDYNEPAPERWPQDLKEAYNEAPPNMRKLFMERLFKPMQRQYTQTTMELAEKRKQVEPILETLKQHEETLKAQGIDPAEAVKNTLQWQRHFAQVGPEKGIEDLRASMGLTDRSGNEVQEEYLTPTERAMKERLDRLEATHQQEQQRQQQTQAQQQEEMARQQAVRRVQQDLMSFARETDENGNPAHPHVKELAPTMSGLIRGGLVSQQDEYGNPVPYKEQLRQAYEKAVEMSPQFRSAVQKRGQVQRAKQARDIGVEAKSAPHVDDDADLPISELISKTYDRMQR